MTPRLLVTLFGCMTLAGCFSPPFAPVELVPVGDVDPAAVRDAFARRLAPRYESEDTVVLRVFWKKVAMLGYTRVDREVGTFETIALNHLGVPIFRVGGDTKGDYLRFALPEIKEYPQFSEGVASDIRRIAFDLVPGDTAEAEVRSDRVIFRESRDGGVMEYVFAGCDLLLIQKRFTTGWFTDWTVDFYEYRNADGFVYPRGVVFYNGDEKYRLIIETRDMTFDIEKDRTTGTAP